MRPAALLGSLALWTAPWLCPAAAVSDYRTGVEAYRAGDFERARREWLMIAGQPQGEGDPAVQAEAAYALAMLHWMGQGVQQDTSEAAFWLLRAAILNHAGAQSKLGYLYLTGQGVPKSEFEALKWLGMAANQNDADAQYNLGVMYRDGQGVAASPERALEWFSEAAANGDEVSRAILAEYERTGSFATREPEPALPAGSSIAAVPESAAEPTIAEEASIGERSMLKGLAGQNELGQPSSVGDASWIASRDPDHFTIQVIAVRNTVKVEEFIARHPEWQPFALFPQGPPDRTLWVLVQGDYPDLEGALAARDRFPPEIQLRSDLLVRRFAAVQALLQ